VGIVGGEALLHADPRLVALPRLGFNLTAKPLNTVDQMIQTLPQRHGKLDQGGIQPTAVFGRGMEFQW